MIASELLHQARFCRGSHGLAMLVAAGMGSFAVDAPAQQASVDETVETVVVTGSRLRRDTLEAPIPIVSIDTEELELSGATGIGDLVSELPALGIGPSRVSNVGIGAPEAIGTNSLDLRSLGENRTLVVVDGRRHIGSVRGTTAVDVDSIPVALIERIDIATGGASVAYGADAVSGVVNVILKNDFEGVELDVRGGATGEGDAEDYYASLTTGGGFGDERGNATLNVTFNRVHEVNGRDRDWLARQRVFIPNPANTGPNDGIPAQIMAENGRVALLPFQGILAGLLTGLPNQPNPMGPILQFNPDGSVRPYDRGQFTGGAFNIGGDGLDITEIQTIANPLERVLLNGRVRYELAPSTHVFLEGKYYGVETSFVGQPTADVGIHQEDGDFFFLAPDNPFLNLNDPQLAALFAQNPAIPAVFPTSAGRSLVIIAKFHDDLGRRSYDVDRDTYRVLGGVEGELTFADSDWELFYQYGESREARTDENNRHARRFRLATDVTRDAAGNPACRARVQAMGPTFDRDIDNCVPLNIFGVGLASQAALDYALVDLVNRAKLTQHVAGANMNGELFDLPGGPVGFAVGAEFRRETSDFQPDSLFVQGAVFDGQILPVNGEYEVIEGFLEARVPILADLPAAKLLSIEGGVRFSDYDSIGNTTSWRGALEWAPLTDLRLRGGAAKAVRAPNVGELFAPVRPSFGGVLDPCDRLIVGLGPNPAQRLANCTAHLAPLGLNPTTFVDPQRGVTKRVIVGGNPDLSEETSETATIGLVFTPRFLKGFSAAVDAFDIEIEEAIEAPLIQQIVNDCYDRFDSTTNEFCALFERVAGGGLNGVIRNVRATQLNIAALETRGIDFTLRQAIELGGRLGDSLTLSLVGTYLDEANFLPASNAADVDIVAGELIAPRWRGVLDATYQNGPLTLGWRLRYIGEAVFDREEDPVEIRSPNGTSGHPISDVQIRYRFGEGTRFDAYVGVNNAFDREPPAITRPGVTGGFASPLYDPIGRFFYGGLKVNLQ